jgi:hypothetical protein
MWTSLPDLFGTDLPGGTRLELVTLRPPAYSDVSNPGTATGGEARQFSEPSRELGALALLTGNAVFLFLGLTSLLMVINGWGSEFGLRCARVFGTFVGPLALGLPLLAVLLATHVAPMLARSRSIVITALVEYGVSALFGVITFLGAFAHDLSSVRATVEGLLGRSVWLGFLVLASILLVRIFTGLFPARRAASYGTYRPATYGRPYPGQPIYPHATYQPGVAGPVYPSPGEAATDDDGSGWPVVPPPPMPGPLRVQPSPTVRITPPSPTAPTAPSPTAPAAPAPAAAPPAAAPPAAAVSPPGSGGEATQLVPPPPPSQPRSEPTTRELES